jgi:hypothetical protein
VIAGRSDPVPDDARRARVFPHVDRAQRIAAMLTRWQAEDVSGEPEWNLAEIEPLSFERTPVDREASTAGYRSPRSETAVVLTNNTRHFESLSVSAVGWMAIPIS